MSALPQDTFSERLPTEIEVGNADHLRKIMAGLVQEDEPAKIGISSKEGEVADVVLSPAIAHTFMEVLRMISSGRGFRMIPLSAELTTQQAADHLNVSRPYLIKLLEQGAIPFSKTGRHRRVRAEDLFAYKASRDDERSDAMSDMARIDAEKGYL